MKGSSHWVLIVMLGSWAMLGVGCTATHNYTIDYAKYYPSAQQRVVDKPAIVLQVEDAILEEEFLKVQNFLGKDMTMFETNLIIIPGQVFNSYSADQPRSQLVSSVLQEHFSIAGLPALDLSRHKPSQSIEEVHEPLSLSAQIKQLAVTTSFSNFIPLLIVNDVYFHNKQVTVVLECQVMQPGNQTPLWKGTVSGKAENKELETMEETARASIKDSDAWMVHEAIDRAVSGLLTQSQVVQMAARLRNETFAKAMKTAQDTATSGNLKAALNQYGHAYRAAGNRAQALTVIQTVADTVRKLPTKPELPENARRYGVQATTQTEQKHYNEALALFSQSLEAAPWWAEGHFNRALLFANQERYQDAVASMNHFLILAPNAPDARAAQDKIYEWELKAK